MAGALRWEVVGGESTGGILVRKECDLTSPQIGRVSTGGEVKELERRGDRLLYELVSGSGPRTGWVSLKLKEKVLLTPKAKSPGSAQSEVAGVAPRTFKDVDTKLSGEIDANTLDDQPEVVAQGGPQGNAPSASRKQEIEFEAHIFAIVNETGDLSTLNPRKVKDKLEDRLGLPKDSLNEALKLIAQIARAATRQRMTVQMQDQAIQGVAIRFTLLPHLESLQKQGRRPPSKGSPQALASLHVEEGDLDAAAQVLSEELEARRQSDDDQQTSDSICAALLVARGHVYWKDLRFTWALGDFSEAERLQPGGVASASLLFLRHCMRLDVLDTLESKVGHAGADITQFFKEAAVSRRLCSQKQAEMRFIFRPRATEPLRDSESEPHWACPGMQIFDGSCSVEAYGSHSAADIGYRLLVNRESKPEDTVLLVYYHGNGEVAPEYTSWADVYKKFPCTFLVFDYRGYGWSTGEPHVECLTADPMVCMRKLPDMLRRHQLPCPWPGPVILMGRSLGSVVAANLIAHFPEMFDGLIIESGMATSKDERYEETLSWSGTNRDETSVAFQTARELVRASLPPGCELGQEVISPLGTVDAIRGYRGPVLILHGAMDTIVSPDNARRNYEAASNSCDRDFALFPADHNSLAGVREFWQKQLLFARKVLKRKQLLTAK